MLTHLLQSPPGWVLKGALRPNTESARRGRRQRCRAYGRQHFDPTPSPCLSAQGATQNQALGRSRGGFTTKIHAWINAEGLPVALILKPCKVYDRKAFIDLIAKHNADPDVLLGGKGGNYDAIRDKVRTQGGMPEILTKKNRHIQHTIKRTLYATRDRIECFLNRFKNSRRVPTRYNHTASSFVGFAKIATIKQWIGFVHPA